MNKIFTYTNYRKYLGDYYEFRKAKDHYFSFRFFSKKAGFGSPSWLKFVIDGERNLSPESIEKFIDAIGLKEKEAEYFRVLVQFNQAKTEKFKNRYFAQLMKLTAGPEFKHIQKGQYEFYSKWYHSAIRELVNLPQFKEDPYWIAKQLNPPIKPIYARRSLKLLESLGFLRRNQQGDLIQSDPIITTGDEVTSLSIRNFHRQMMALAQESIERFPRSKREISALTLGISQKCFEKLKARIVAFEDELLEMAANDSSKSSLIYQLNFQLFPLVNTKETEK